MPTPCASTEASCRQYRRLFVKIGTQTLCDLCLDVEFESHSFASLSSQLFYLGFLMVYSYVVLVKMPPLPSPQEWVVILYIFSSAVEKVREVRKLICPRRSLSIVSFFVLLLFYSELFSP